MTLQDTDALAMLDRLAAHLDPWSLDYAASQWLECTLDYERRDWFERMESVIAYWEAEERPPEYRLRRPG